MQNCQISFQKIIIHFPDIWIQWGLRRDARRPSFGICWCTDGRASRSFSALARPSVPTSARVSPSQTAIPSSDRFRSIRRRASRVSQTPSRKFCSWTSPRSLAGLTHGGTNLIFIYYCFQNCNRIRRSRFNKCVFDNSKRLHFPCFCGWAGTLAGLGGRATRRAASRRISGLARVLAMVKKLKINLNYNLFLSCNFKN